VCHVSKINKVLLTIINILNCVARNTQPTHFLKDPVESLVLCDRATEPLVFCHWIKVSDISKFTRVLMSLPSHCSVIVRTGTDVALISVSMVLSGQ